MGVSVVITGSGVLSSIGKPAAPVQVLRMLTNADQAGATPALNHSESAVVNNWGVAPGDVYVGVAAGQPFVNGDIAQQRDDLGGFVRVLQNVAGFVPANRRVLVIGAGALGDFVGQENNVARSDGAGNFAFSIPQDGDRVLVIGEEETYENQTFVYDVLVTGWYSQGVVNIPLSNQVFVDQDGDNSYGTGKIERPFQTITQALTAAVAGDTVVVGPGVYPEQVVLDGRVNLIALVPGSVTIQADVPAGAVLEILGPANNCLIDGIDVENLSAVGAGAIALHLNNLAGLITGPINFRNGNISSGGGLSRALQYTGDAGVAAACRLNIKSSTLTGSIDLQLVMANDIVFFEVVEATGGLAAWFNIVGPAGRVIMSQFLLAAAPNNETIDFGGGVICGVNLSMGNSVIAGILNLNNLAGAGIVALTAGNQIAQILAALEEQILHRYLGADELQIECRNIDANPLAPADILMYTVPVGRSFNPHTVRTVNRGLATGGALDYGMSGTGAYSIVTQVGIGVLDPGVANEVVNQDQIVGPAGQVNLSIAAPSGQPNDTFDAIVTGYLF